MFADSVDSFTCGCGYSVYCSELANDQRTISWWLSLCRRLTSLRCLNRLQRGWHNSKSRMPQRNLTYSNNVAVNSTDASMRKLLGKGVLLNHQPHVSGSMNWKLVKLRAAPQEVSNMICESCHDYRSCCWILYSWKIIVNHKQLVGTAQVNKSFVRHCQFVQILYFLCDHVVPHTGLSIPYCGTIQSLVI